MNVPWSIMRLTYFIRCLWMKVIQQWQQLKLNVTWSNARENFLLDVYVKRSFSNGTVKTECNLSNCKIVSCHTADSKLVKQKVNGTVILPPLVFPGFIIMVLTRFLSIARTFRADKVRNESSAKDVKTLWFR